MSGQGVGWALGCTGQELVGTSGSLPVQAGGRKTRACPGDRVKKLCKEGEQKHRGGKKRLVGSWIYFIPVFFHFAEEVIELLPRCSKCLSRQSFQNQTVALRSHTTSPKLLEQRVPSSLSCIM